MSDDALVSAAKRGEQEAWRALYLEHAGRLVMWLRTRPTGDSAAAPEDVAAEAWFVAASKVAEFEGSSSDFGGWLFGIARRISATSRRTWQRRNTRPTEGEALALDPVPDHGPDVAHQDWLRAVLAGLPPRERAAVGLVDGLGMDPKTAAEVLGISAVTLRVARHRGLRRLAGRSASRAAFDSIPGAAPGL
ncbi:MAG: RNA polymerase sigma factor [Aeromicrobium sp.]